MLNIFIKITLSLPASDDPCFTLLNNADKLQFSIILANSQASFDSVSDLVDNDNFQPDILRQSECYALKKGPFASDNGVSSMAFEEKSRSYENCFTSDAGKQTSYMYVFVNTGTLSAPEWTLGTHGLKIQCDQNSIVSGSSELTSGLAGLTQPFFQV